MQGESMSLFDLLWGLIAFFLGAIAGVTIYHYAR